VAVIDPVDLSAPIIGTISLFSEKRNRKISLSQYD